MRKQYNIMTSCDNNLVPYLRHIITYLSLILFLCGSAFTGSQVAPLCSIRSANSQIWYKLLPISLWHSSMNLQTRSWVAVYCDLLCAEYGDIAERDGLAVQHRFFQAGTGGKYGILDIITRSRQNYTFHSGVPLKCVTIDSCHPFGYHYLFISSRITGKGRAAEDEI